MPDELFLISPVNDNFRRDVEVDDEDIVDPNEADALIQGEWLSLDAVSGKYTRHVDETKRGAHQVFTPKGDMGAQAIKKVAVIQLHEYEAETIVFDDGFAGAVGDPLTVGDIVLGGVAGTYCGLKAAAVGNIVYGVVTKLPADNNGKLRFMKSTQGVL